MSKPLNFLAAAGLAAVLALPAAAQDTPSADTVVATVNGTEITLGHMILVRSGLPEQYQQLPADVLWTGILDQLVNQTLLSTADGATETTRVRLAMENERRALLAGEAAQAAANAAVSDEALQALYESRYAAADMALEYNASHILVESEEEAQAIVEEINGGADFAVVAREKSTGPSGPNGGSLGWFGPGMMVQPFQDAVEALEVGAVSAPVKTQFGWHVILLNETRQQEAPALDAVRGELTQELQQTAVSDLLAQLTESAEISRTEAGALDASVLSNLDLLED